MRAEAHTVPPKIKPPASPSLGIFVFVALGAAVLGVCGVVYFFNPNTHGFYPVCIFHELTGLNCPGCGGTRSLYALLHDHLQLALRDNALFVLSLPVVAARGAWFGIKKYRRRPVGPFLPAKFLWVLLGVAVVFTVLRNLPAFTFLSP